MHLEHGRKSIKDDNGKEKYLNTFSVINENSVCLRKIKIFKSAQCVEKNSQDTLGPLVTETNVWLSVNRLTCHITKKKMKKKRKE